MHPEKIDKRCISPMLVTSSRNPFDLAPMLNESIPQYVDTHEFLEPVISRHSMFDRILARLTSKARVLQINMNLIHELRKNSVRSLLVFKGMNILPRTLSLAKEMGVKLFNYNADHPLDYFQPGSGNKRVFDSYSLYDAHFTYSHEIRKSLLARFPEIKVFVVPFGHNISDEFYKSLRVEEEINKVCFIGNPDLDRAKFISGLAELGLRIDVYGENWHGFLPLDSELESIRKFWGRNILPRFENTEFN